MGLIVTRSHDEWATPQSFFDELDKEFHFTVDVCASHENHKCDWYFTQEDDGLSKNWGGQTVFCNPPYSEIGKWVKKAHDEAKKDGTVVVMLIPSRTSTKYFHDYIYHRTEIRFVSGRLHFNDGKGRAPFPSMVVIFRGAKTKV